MEVRDSLLVGWMFVLRVSLDDVVDHVDVSPVYFLIWSSFEMHVFTFGCIDKEDCRCPIHKFFAISHAGPHLSCVHDIVIHQEIDIVILLF